ncbi:MAG: PfkB family carbohydrate kinase [Acidobacteriota bacterium]
MSGAAVANLPEDLSPEQARGLLELVPRLDGRRVLVVGDWVADEFVFTGAGRVSREAPVLILRHERSTIVPGAAANAVANIAALGGVPVACAQVGEDEWGERLSEQLAERGTVLSGLQRRPAWPTPRKCRILAGDRNVALQQVVRVDHGCDPCPPAELPDVATLLDDVDGVLLSDYGLGFVTDELVARCLDGAKERGLTTCLDSRHRLLDHPGIDACTPSEQELEEALGGSVESAETRAEMAGAALDRTHAKVMVLTRGSQGMEVYQPGQPTVSLAAFGSGGVADVTGAGDTVIATFSLALAAGIDAVDAARLANVAAGIVVTKIGTETASPEEIAAALRTRAED